MILCNIRTKICGQIRARAKSEIDVQHFSQVCRQEISSTGSTCISSCLQKTREDVLHLLFEVWIRFPESSSEHERPVVEFVKGFEGATVYAEKSIDCFPSIGRPISQASSFLQEVQVDEIVQRAHQFTSAHIVLRLRIA